jgi:hypothetical protein
MGIYTGNELPRLVQLSLASTVFMDYGRLMNNSSMAGKFGDPRPVTGSQPTAALNPFVPQPGLLPEVISFRT